MLGFKNKTQIQIKILHISLDVVWMITGLKEGDKDGNTST